MAKNPVRNYAIEYVGGKSVTELDAAAIAAAAIEASQEPSGDELGEVVDDTDVLPLIETLPTDETDASLVYGPDGAGGVIARSVAGSSFVPTLLAPLEQFVIPDNRQALFALPIVLGAGAGISIGSNSALVEV